MKVGYAMQLWHNIFCAVFCFFLNILMYSVCTNVNVKLLKKRLIRFKKQKKSKKFSKKLLKLPFKKQKHVTFLLKCDIKKQQNMLKNRE